MCRFFELFAYFWHSKKKMWFQHFIFYEIFVIYDFNFMIFNVLLRQFWKVFQNLYVQHRFFILFKIIKISGCNILFINVNFDFFFNFLIFSIFSYIFNAIFGLFSILTVNFGVQKMNLVSNFYPYIVIFTIYVFLILF